MKPHRRSVLVSLILLSAVAIAGGVARAFFWPPTHSSLIRQVSPQDILEHIRNLHGRLTFIHFWASWCEPCKLEFGSVLQVKKDFEAQGVNLVLVSVDGPEDRTAAEVFLREQKVDFPSFYKGSQSLDFVSQLYPEWKGAVPASLLVAPDLKILDAWEGDTSLEEFRNRILKQLRGS